MDTPDTAAGPAAPHQLGGVDGFSGPIPGIDDAERFHEGWEARVFALMRAATDGRLFTTDQFRDAIERLDAGEYHRISYFERWLAAVERVAVERGLLTADELEAAQQRRFAGHDDDHPDPPHIAAGAAQDVRPPEPAEPLPVGAPVRLVDGLGRHHRLPDWARGRRGRIHAVRGLFELPDLIVAGASEGRRYPLYAVEIPAREAFADAHPSDLVYLDAYHPYLRQEG